MLLRFLTNSRKLSLIIENEIKTNETVYGGKLFSTQDDFIEHLYRLAMVVSNNYCELNKSHDDGSISIIVGHGSRYVKTFNI